MIVRMAKIEIVGEKSLLQEVLRVLRELGVFQIEPARIERIEDGHEQDIRSFMLDEKTAFERAFLNDLRAKIAALLASLPNLQVRSSYLDPRPVIDSIAGLIDRHTTMVRERNERQEELRKERVELTRYGAFLGTLAPLVQRAQETPDIDFIGLTIREPGMVNRLREAISRITNWKYELMTEPAEDGTLVGLITVEKESSDRVKKALHDEQVPELAFPPSFGNFTFSEKVAYVKDRIATIDRTVAELDDGLAQFARRWTPIYRSVRDWIDDRLSLLSTTAAAYETRMCFFIDGWMPSDDVPKVKTALTNACGTSVSLVQKELREEDMERVPIALKNPPYFRLFEMFTAVLPLPSYTSYDPTPFIGIFFPVFFGMILGDAGYGLVLVILAAVLLRRHRRRTLIGDGARVLLVASLYAIFFGVLFGEFFGDLPERLLHLEPICIERRTAIMPMILFTLAVGVCHVMLGLVLGAVAGFRKKERKEAIYKLLSVAAVMGLIVAIASASGALPARLGRPVVIGILLLSPLLFLTGGLLAPLELLKNIGNIISYVRIMAIGLTSVLLAFVANRLAGLTGDIVTGVVVAGLLHLLNIILGVFAPTIHSLRLHYVEFFGKFMEHGGRRFEPLKK